MFVWLSCLHIGMPLVSGFDDRSGTAMFSHAFIVLLTFVLAPGDLKALNGGDSS
jgi:hypothetical protein